MTTDKSSSHISQRYDDELSGVKSQLFEMGGIVEKQFQDAFKSLLDVDIGIAEAIMPPSEQSSFESYRPSNDLKFYFVFFYKYCL